MKNNPIEKAVEWLLEVRNKDGGWGIIAGTGASSTITNTGEVLYALSLCGVDSDILKPSVDYLCKAIETDHCQFVRHYAWSCMALLMCGVNPDHPCIDKSLVWLRSNRHPEGGWAHTNGGKPSIYPTFAAISALLAASEKGYSSDINRNHASHGILWIVGIQNPDNGWGFSYSDPSNACATAYAILALQNFGQPNSERHISSASSLIISKQTQSGLWRDDVEYSTPTNKLKYSFHHFSTAWALLALESRFKFHDPPLARALSALYQLQSENGGWQSPSHAASTTWATSQALLVLKRFEENFDLQEELPDIIQHVVALNTKISNYEESQIEKDSDTYFFSRGKFWVRISANLAYVIVILYLLVSLLTDMFAYLYWSKLALKGLVIGQSIIFGVFIYVYARQKKGESPYFAIITTAGLMGFIFALIELLL